GEISYRQRDDRRRLADSLLEKFYKMDLEFDMIVSEEKQSPLQEIPHMEDLAKAEHMNLVNHKILAGYRYGPDNDDRHFFSKFIKPWDELPEEQKNCFCEKVSALLPMVNSFFGKECKSSHPYGFVQHQFRSVCGFIDNSESSLNWYSGAQANGLYQNLIRNLRVFHRSTKNLIREYKTIKLLDRYFSLAVLCTMEDDANAMFVDMANREKIPVIAILPQKPEQYQYHFPEGRNRDQFWRRLRNVYTYYVIPDNVTDPRKFICDIISKYSDEVWYLGNFELTCDPNADLPELGKYIRPRSSKPFLREIQQSGTLVPPYPKLIHDKNESLP
ncbi:MAG: hypothetical protein IKO93_04740, partial [Lentisphaeria bacterium]|nr:hypothetical protein [Lentisphaeria bacterium]